MKDNYSKNMRVAIREMLTDETIERIGVDETRDLGTCLVRICGELRAQQERANTLAQRLHALGLICGTTDANRFETVVDRLTAERDQLAEWKRQQLIVNRMWDDVRDCVTRSPLEFVVS